MGTLRAKWAGNNTRNENLKVFLTFGDSAFPPCPMNQERMIPNIPITSNRLRIAIATGNGVKKPKTRFAKVFNVNAGDNYECLITHGGDKGYGIRLSKGNQPLTKRDPVCYSNYPIACLSFLFPIFGIVNAIRSGYNRIAAITASAAGFIFATLFSVFADGEKLVSELDAKYYLSTILSR